MLADLRLTQYRGFRFLHLGNLGRVNLLIGANGTGKTSVLEAAEILLTPGVPWTLARIAGRRGEASPSAPAPTTMGPFVIRHLFPGHQIEPGACFQIEGSASAERRVRCEIHASRASLPEESRTALSWARGFSWVLAVSGDLGGGGFYAVSEDGRLPVPEAGSRDRKKSEGVPPVSFLATVDPEPESIGVMWDRIVLTPEEARVADALRVIDDRIERVAPMASMGGMSWWSLFAKLRGADAPVPLGSLGEGIRRLLMLAVGVAGSAGGTLLVDDIDTGLHHSVMVKMWRMLIESARRLDVQVFATTHSHDCVQALARLYERDQSLKDDIVVHRIEQAREVSTLYTAEELLVAARHDMEIR